MVLHSCQTELIGDIVSQYGKRLRDIQCPSGTDTVIVHFEDNTTVTGNLLIGADGANSRVREFLLGREKAALQPLAVFGCGTVERLSADISRKIRDINDLYFVAYHPEGPCAFMARKCPRPNPIVGTADKNMCSP